MAKFSYFGFKLILVFAAAVVVVVLMLVVDEVNSQKRCQVVLNPNGCNLLACRQQCLQSYNGNRVCVENSPGSATYRCVCFYNCSLTP
ncbi:putative defensin-like protein 165 [Camellia lanceoleosa]|uniref:Defensin-like protein 165 n=1 Tax=Camellia lanceoleosa TaxID=1840588 RepID=A0ACC0GT65_9ERIC|nr:putative defensin-like protein 165 [Camellia lanceoleosa]